MFERYVNFEFYKTRYDEKTIKTPFQKYVNLMTIL